MDSIRQERHLHGPKMLLRSAVEISASGPELWSLSGPSRDLDSVPMTRASSPVWYRQSCVRQRQRGLVGGMRFLSKVLGSA